MDVRIGLCPIPEVYRCKWSRDQGRRSPAASLDLSCLWCAGL